MLNEVDYMITAAYWRVIWQKVIDKTWSKPL